MNKKFAFLLLFSLIFIESIKANQTEDLFQKWGKKYYKDYLYKHLWFYSKGHYTVPYKTIHTPVRIITLYRRATLKDIAQKLQLPETIIIEKMNEWNLPIPKE